MAGPSDLKGEFIIMRHALLSLFFVNVVSAATVTPLTSKPQDINLAVLNLVPHVVDGGFWKTTFKFVNLETHAVTLTMTFGTDDGNAMSLPFLRNADVDAGDYSLLQVSLLPAESLTLETAGTAPTLTSGWALIQQQNGADRIGKFAIFKQHVPGGQDQEATVSIVQESVEMISSDAVMLFDNTAYVTGIALANPQDITLPIEVYIRNQDGGIIDHQTVSIPSHGHAAFSLPDRWPSTKGIAGALQFVSSGYTFGALGLRFNGAAFTSFEVFPYSAWSTTQ